MQKICISALGQKVVELNCTAGFCSDAEEAKSVKVYFLADRTGKKKELFNLKGKVAVRREKQLFRNSPSLTSQNELLSSIKEVNK